MIHLCLGRISIWRAATVHAIDGSVNALLCLATSDLSSASDPWFMAIAGLPLESLICNTILKIWATGHPAYLDSKCRLLYPC